MSKTKKTRVKNGQIAVIFFILGVTSVTISHQNCSQQGAVTGTPTQQNVIPSGDPVPSTSPTGINFSVQMTGDGTGKITGDVINCSAGNVGVCTSGYNVAQTITLTATPSSGSSFVSWQGYSGCGTAAVCKLTFSSTISVIANFAKTTNSTSTVPVLSTIGLGNKDNNTIWILGQKFTSQTKAHLRLAMNGDVTFEVPASKIILISDQSLQFDVAGLGQPDLVTQMNQKGGLWVTLVNPGDSNFAWPPLLVRPPTFFIDANGYTQAGTGADNNCGIWIMGYQLDYVNVELRKISTSSNSASDATVMSSNMDLSQLSATPQVITFMTPDALKPSLRTMGLQLRLVNKDSGQTSLDATVPASPNCN